MVGNVNEWVGDWADRANVGCANWMSLPGGNLSCFGGNGSGGSNQIPGALFRGGTWDDGGVNTGVFAVSADSDPSYSSDDLGFRCAR